MCPDDALAMRRSMEKSRSAFTIEYLIHVSACWTLLDVVKENCDKTSRTKLIYLLSDTHTSNIGPPMWVWIVLLAVT